jgi:hypothetical protein
MTTPQKVIAGVLGLLLVVAGTAWIVYSHKSAKGTQNEIVARIADGQANIATVAAAQAGVQVQAITAANAPLQKDVDSARAEVQRLRKLLAAQPKPSPNPPGSDPANVQPVADPGINVQLDHAKDVLIDDQDKQIQGLKAESAAKTVQINQLNEALALRLKAEQAQQAATEAWKGAVTSAEWKGGFKGLAIGAIVGYLGAKR